MFHPSSPHARRSVKLHLLQPFFFASHAMVAAAAAALVILLTLPGSGFGQSATGSPINYGNLYPFTGANGSRPDSGPIRGQDGNFYGVTRAGGANGLGTIYRISAANFTVTTLYSFTGGADGFFPSSSLYQDTDGRFYGTTNGFAPAVSPTVATYGTLYRFTLPASPTDAFTVQTLHTFLGGNDGSDPRGALVSSPDGVLFGTTVGGGGTPAVIGQGGSPGGYGTIYTFDPFDGGDFYSVAYSFSNNDYTYDEYAPQYNDGAYPVAGLTVAPNAGSTDFGPLFYGTTSAGGANGRGTIFGVYAGEGYYASKVYDFTGLTDGASPYDDMVLGPDSNLYGTTSTGGNSDSTGGGTIFRLNLTAGSLSERPAAARVTPVAPSAAPADGPTYYYPTGITTLHAFNPADDGLFPNGLYASSDGYLYGTTAGVTGDGVTPPPGLLPRTAARVVGPGVDAGNGTIFRLSYDGSFATLYNFTGDSDGGGPRGGLVPGVILGSFFGVNNYGGQTGPTDRGNLFFFLARSSLVFINPTTNLPTTGYRVSEAAGFVQLTVARQFARVGVASLTYSTTNGSAAAGRDYTAVSGTLTWGDGDNSNRVITVPILNNSVADGSRTFSMNLFSNNSAFQSSAGVTINDDDGGTTPTPTPGGSGTGDGTAVPFSLTLASPPDNVAIVSGAPLPLVASATDPQNLIQRVQFYLNGALLGESTTAPYIVNTAALDPGTYRIDVVATDAQGRQALSSCTIGAVTPDAANPVPGVSILTNLAGRAFAAGSVVPVTVRVDAPAPGDSLARVDFYADGVLFASLDNAGNPLVLPVAQTSAAVPLSGNQVVQITRKDALVPAFNSSIFKADYTMPGADKLVNLVTVALSKLGRAQVSAPTTVQSVASTTDRPPVVSVTTKGRLKVGKRQQVSAIISDPDGTPPAVTLTNASNAAPPNGPSRAQRKAYDASGIISRVEYFVNELKAKDAAEAPFTFDFTPPAAGTYVVSVIATDGAGLATVSEPVTAQAIGPAIVNVAAAGDGVGVEGGKNVRALFTRITGDVSEDLVVNYRLKGTATNGLDYVGLDGQPVSGSITIPAGKISAKLKIRPLQDNLAEGTENLNIKIMPSPDGDYTVGDSPKAKLQIVDQSAAQPVGSDGSGD